MKIKKTIFLVIILYLIINGGCKKKTPTGPTGSNGDMTLEISGIITLNGQPFSNINVFLSWGASQKVKTGGDGKFSFTNLLRGDYIITPSKRGYAFSPSNYQVNDTNRDLSFTAQIATFGSQVGDIAANFTAKDQHNQNVSLYKYFGKVILFDFSAEWCGPCRDEASHLQDLYNQYEDKGFRVITLLTDGNPSEWADEYNLSFPVLDDNKSKFWNIYGEGYIPLNIVVDRNCTIRYKKAGYNESEIETCIEKYL